jgi:hypothetical protein
MTLFASVSAGAPKGTFSKRQAAYDSVIGKFEAVRVQIATRPVPQVNPVVVRLVAPKEGTAENTPKLEIPAAPTTEVVSKIVRDITFMRDTDKASGIPAMIVIGFKREYEISIEQALVYEKQLER